MPPTKGDPKRGYYINAARKRKQQAESNNSKKQKETEVSDDIADDLTPDNSSTASSDIQIPSPLSPDAMDTDTLNMPDGNIGGASTAGGSAAVPQTAIARTVGGSTGGGTGGGLRGTAILPTTWKQHPLKTTRTYRKQYLLRLQNEAAERKGPVTLGDSTSKPFGYIRYPYHDLPVHMLGFYLSEGEIRKLDRFTSAYVKHCKVKVYNKTAVLNFETAASTANIGNNNVGVYLSQVDPKISSKRCGLLPSNRILIEDLFWGKPFPDYANPINEWDTDLASLGAQYVRRTLNNKFEYMTPYATVSAGEAPTTSYFDIHPHIIHRTNASMTEGLFTEWNYKPKKGLVSGNFTAFEDNFNERIFNTNERMPIWKANAITPNIQPLGRYNTGGQGNGTETAIPNVHMKFPYRNPVIKSSILIDDYMLGGNAKIPALCIGIDTLTTAITIPGGSDKWEPVKCFVDLIVQTECEIEITDGVDYTNPTCPQENFADYMFPEYGVYTTNNYMVRTNPDYQIMGNEVVENQSDGVQNTIYSKFTPTVSTLSTNNGDERMKAGRKARAEFLSKKPIGHTHYLRSLVDQEKRRQRAANVKKPTNANVNQQNTQVNNNNNNNID